MNYYRIDVKEVESATQIIRTLKNSRTWVRSIDDPLVLYAATGNDHNSHVEEISKEFNAVSQKINKSDIPPEITRSGGVPKREYKAFDGTMFTDKTLFAHYEKAHNPKNKRAISESTKVRKPRSPKIVRQFRIEPGLSFDFEGVQKSLTILEEKLLQAYNEVSDLRKHFDKIGELNQLLKDRDDYLKSAREILKMV